MNIYRAKLASCCIALFSACLNSVIAKADSPAVMPAATVTDGAPGKVGARNVGSVKGLTDDCPSAAAPRPATRDTGDLTDLSLEDLMNVQVISVSKKKQSLADAPAAITVIDQDMIARSGFSTIPDLLRLAPGMDVARINSQTWAISSRGRNDTYADDLLVIQDGRTVYQPVDSGVNWNSVDYILQDLDRLR